MKEQFSMAISNINQDITVYKKQSNPSKKKLESMQLQKVVSKAIVIAADAADAAALQTLKLDFGNLPSQILWKGSNLGKSGMVKVRHLSNLQNALDVANEDAFNNSIDFRVQQLTERIEILEAEENPNQKAINELKELRHQVRSKTFDNYKGELKSRIKNGKQLIAKDEAVVKNTLMAIADQNDKVRAALMVVKGKFDAVKCRMAQSVGDLYKSHKSTNIEDAMSKDSLTIATIKAYRGEYTASVYISAWLKQFFAFFSVGKGFNDTQFDALVEIIVNDYYYMTLAEFKHILETLKRNTTYNRMDANIVLRSIENAMTEKGQIAADNAYSHHIGKRHDFDIDKREREHTQSVSAEYVANLETILGKYSNVDDKTIEQLNNL